MGAISFTAYCFASGHIGFGSVIPDGAIALASGKEATVRDVITSTAQLSRQDNDTWFVPGVANAQSQRDGLIALARYLQVLVLRNQPGFRALCA